MSQKFVLVCSSYIIWMKQFKLWKVPIVVSSIVVVGELTYYALCNLKTMQINIQCSLIWELMIYKFKLGHNAVEATRNICCVKGEDTVDQSTVTKWLKKFCSGCKNLNNQERLSRSKTINIEYLSLFTTRQDLTQFFFKVGVLGKR